MEIKSGSHLYQVGKMVAEDEKYHLYLCMQDGTGRKCLLQIATAVEFNGGLSRAAYVLGELKLRADEVETEYAKERHDPKKVLNYDLGFPELLDSFVCHQQDGRQINILTFRSVEDVTSMVPLTNITAKDRLRVDLRTSAWIMGKSLKLLVFTHSEGVAINLVTGKNILIEPDNRYVLFFNWSATEIHSAGMVPAETRRQEISQAAQAVVTVLGGDPATGIIPNDGDEAFDRYTDYLLQLARGRESNAQRAHASFYGIVDLFWKREFYPFTTKPLLR